MANQCKIPVIDLQDFHFSSKLIVACKEWGCFRLLNHNIPTTLMSDMKSVVKSLFDLPVEVKRRNLDIITASGYMVPNKINPLYESLGVYDMASDGAVENFCSQLGALPYQREIITTYVGAVQELFIRIGGKLAEGLGAKSENVGFENWPCQFRINKYHFTPENVNVGSSGVQIHTDSGFLTILQDDEGVGGLEIMDKSGHFIPIEPWPDTLIVNIGDMATLWSNGILRNITHRVLCKEPKIRVSIASFLLGPRGVIEPLKLEGDSHQQPIYMPTTYAEYRKLRFETGLQAGEALTLLEKR